MHYIQAKKILSSQNGMNLYRGCLHGCIYCDSRSRCYQMDHAFEDVAVKENALELLEQELKHKRKKCMIALGSMSDPYLPLEEELGYTRRALAMIARYGFGFTCITKSAGILRDLPLLKEIHDRTKCVVQMTLTTAEDSLCRKVEPNVSTTSERYQALVRLRDEGIPTVVWLCPILPYINDSAENINGILDLCESARVKGVICFGMGLTLREGNREYFYQQLDRLFPGLKQRYIREYGMTYEVLSPRNQELMDLFERRCEKAGILHDNQEIFAYLSAFEDQSANAQISLWDS